MFVLALLIAPSDGWRFVQFAVDLLMGLLFGVVNSFCVIIF